MFQSKLITLLAAATMLFGFAGCSSQKTEAQNMEQIYQQQGVPVKTQIVQPQSFKTQLIYNATLSGLLESSAYASFGGRIEKIYNKVGDYVKKDQVVMSFPVETPSAQYNQAKAAYENAKKNLARLEKLYQKGGVSQQTYDNVRVQYDVAKANWDAVNRSVEVKAPISGIITRIDVSASDNVKRKAELFTVSQTKRLKAKIWVGENEICDIQPGLPAVAEWHGRQIKGQVKQVDLSMNVMHQAFGVVLEFDNSDNAVVCGTTAEIKIFTYRNPQAIVVPTKTLVKRAGKRYVYLAQNGVAKLQPVTVGRSSGLNTEILSGLQAGDTLITEGQLLLEDGRKIKIIE